MILASNATGTAASMMFENTKPVRKSTLSSRTYFSAIWRPTSGLNWSSPTSTSAGKPPSLPPFIFTASWKPSRMSTPSAALGPESVLMKPTLTLFAASALTTKASAIPTAMSLPLIILVPPRRQDFNCSSVLAVHIEPVLRQPPRVVGNREDICTPADAARTFLVQLAAAVGSTDNAAAGGKAARELLGYSTLFTALKFIPGAEPWAWISVFGN